MSTASETPVEPLNLEFKVDKPSTCERHVVVTIPRGEVDRYFRQAFDDLGPKAEMPGFRVGKAPRKLVESRFRPQIKEQVKSSLVLDALQKITEGGEFSAISEPNMDFGAIDIPDAGDFTFEFKIEVRPEFDTPNWKGLQLKRAVYTVVDSDVDDQLSKTLQRFSEGEAVDGEAQLGDTLILNASFFDDGKEISSFEEEKIILRKRLSLADALIEDFDKLMVGVREGEKRQGKVKIATASMNEAYRGKTIDVEFTVVEIRRVTVGELQASVLDQLGFEAVDELRDFVRAELQKQQEYFQRQDLRKQVTAALTKDAKWDLPAELVNKQTTRELQRQVLEMRRGGFSDDEVRSYLNVARRNAQEMTVAALREHFVLEKIAEDLKIDATPEDYDKEIALIAENSGVSDRKVRSRLEKQGQMDALRNQIIENRVIDMIAAEAEMTDVEDNSFLKKAPEESAIDFAVAPFAGTDIPEAKYDNRATDGQTEGSTVKLQNS